jgi:hypothetical protein
MVKDIDLQSLPPFLPARFRLQDTYRLIFKKIFRKEISRKEW